MRRGTFLAAATAALLRGGVEEELAAARVPGAVLVEVLGNERERIECWGLASRNPDVAMGPNIILTAASLSKQLTAYAVLNEPRIDLDRPLDEDPKLSPRHLLSHSSGWVNWRREEKEALRTDDKPGSRFRYSGEGYVRLQKLLEVASGLPFGIYMSKKVFEPLSMATASFAWNEGLPRAEGVDGQGQARRSRLKQVEVVKEVLSKWKMTAPEMRVGDQMRLCKELGVPPLPNFFVLNAAASLEVSAVDYAKFLKVALRESRFGQQQVEIKKGKGWSLGWGLGWGIEAEGNKNYWWQWGDNGGYKNFVWAEPAKGHAWAVFTNGDKGRPVYERLLRERTKLDPAAFRWLD